MKKLRSSTVEPVLGTLLGFQGMRKVYTKGIDLANKHVLLACTAYNLKKLMRFETIKSIAKTMELHATALISAFVEDVYCFYAVLTNNGKMAYKNVW